MLFGRNVGKNAKKDNCGQCRRGAEDAAIL